LGNKATAERITTGNETAFNTIYEPGLVTDLGPEKITQLTSSQQHSITLDEKGYVIWILASFSLVDYSYSTVHVWGYNNG
ncbi:hypothetical protein EDD18DRAFT_1070388, partial [Armillaria luteobubalina]